MPFSRYDYSVCLGTMFGQYTPQAMQGRSEAEQEQSGKGVNKGILKKEGGNQKGADGGSNGLNQAMSLQGLQQLVEDCGLMQIIGIKQFFQVVEPILDSITNEPAIASRGGVAAISNPSLNGVNKANTLSNVM
jgi:hypothetical protein